MCVCLVLTGALNTCYFMILLVTQHATDRRVGYSMEVAVRERGGGGLLLMIEYVCECACVFVSVRVLVLVHVEREHK